MRSDVRVDAGIAKPFVVVDEDNGTLGDSSEEAMDV